MCGLFGTISFEHNKDYLKRKEVMAQAFVIGTLRGMDSTGLFAVPYKERKEDVIIYKKSMAGYDFIQLPKVGAILNNLDFYRYFVGHHRAATYGKPTSANAHPFNVDHITLAHNGTLQSMFGYHADHNSFTVDSELIAHVIAKEGYKKALETLNGPAAIIWYDAKEETLNLYRNEERPLFFVKVKAQDTIYIASELSMLKHLTHRNNVEVEEAYEVEKDTVCIFKESVKPVDIVTIKPVPKYSYKEQFYPPVVKDKFENFKKKKGKLTVNEVLENCRVKIGQTISFTYDGIEFSGKHSRHGSVTGTMTTSPWADVQGHGVDPKEIGGVNVLSGEVCGVTQNPPGNYIIIVNKVKVDDRNDDVNEVMGPENKMISKKDFNELVKYGCAHCQAGILPIHADMITWTINKEPLCMNCKDEDQRQYMN